MGRRRALVLVGVHVVVLLHVLHWLATGATLTPLEPSEAGYAIRDGLVNAGAILLVLTIAATLLLGRFFCGWACHVVAYQDLARWVLVKTGLRPVAFRSRVLALVPLFAAFWIYGLPLLERLRRDAPPPTTLHLATDDLWATFPGPGIAIATLLVCGAAVIVLLGAKGFCSFGCPYGAFYALADRAARGRIRVGEACIESGVCTRVCSSGVDVAREVATYGHVVDPGCMKCLDCVTACPTNALAYGFRPRVARPPVARSQRRGRSDLGVGEEILVGLAFAGAFAAWYDFARAVPFLLAIGIALIVAIALLAASRVPRRADVAVQRLELRRAGRTTRVGVAFLAATALLVAATAYAGVVRLATRPALDAWETARSLRITSGGNPAAWSAAADAAEQGLDRLDRLWPLGVRGTARMRGEIAWWRGDFDAALAQLDRAAAEGSRSRRVPLHRGLALLALERDDAAREAFDAAFAGRSPPRERFALAEWELTGLGHRRPARRPEIGATRLALLRRAIEVRPDDADVAVRLCRLLVEGTGPRDAVATARDEAEALAVAEQVAAAAPAHPMLLGTLAALRARAGDAAGAADAAARGAEAARQVGDATAAKVLDEDAAAYRRAVEAGG